MRAADLALGWRTDLMFARFDGTVIERDDCIVVRSPTQPTYWWGNFLMMPRAPAEGDFAAWSGLFAQQIAAGQPQSRHLAFGIGGGVPGTGFVLPADFASAGCTAYRSIVLTLQPGLLDPSPRPLPREFSIRALELPARSDAAVELSCAVDDAGERIPGYRAFRERLMRRYTAMQDAGLGHWFGVFVKTPRGEQLVAGCGLFREKRGRGGIARFQLVETHPEWRRQGLATALVHAVCRHGLEVMGDDTLVIVADPDDVAIGIYESLGFERIEDRWAIERKPPVDA